jgi:hypothetical protein
MKTVLITLLRQLSFEVDQSKTPLPLQMDFDSLIKLKHGMHMHVQPRFPSDQPTQE